MRKALSALLAIMLCLTLCSCGIQEQEEKPSLQITEEMVKYVGTWVELGPSGSNIVLNADGSAQVNEEGYSDREFSWGEHSDAPGKPSLADGSFIAPFYIEEYLGFTALSTGAGYYVRLDELDARLEKITLTPEVFQQYFQIDNMGLSDRLTGGETDTYGNTTSAIGGAFIYSNRLNLLPNCKNNTIEVELTYTVTDYKVTIDWNTFQFVTMEEVCAPKEEKTVITIDLGTRSGEALDAYFEDMGMQWLKKQEFKKDDQNFTVSILSDIVVSKAQGTLFVITEP